MPVPENVIVMWPLSGSIPTGWSAESSMNSRFPKGTPASTNPGTNAGADTHVHANSDHLHTTAHGHGLVTTTGPSGAARRGTGSGSTATSSHTHTGTPSNSGGGSIGGSDSWDSDSNDPSYFNFIYIKSDGSPAGLPDGCVVLFDSASAPTGWAQHGASVGRFPRGNSSGGGTGGGVAHTHVNSGTHTHGISSHNHASSGPTSSSGGSYGSDKNSDAASTHTHSSMTLASGGSGTSGATGSGTTGSTTPEPPFKKLQGIENTSGGDNDTLLTICMWLDTLDNIPGEYNLCDGTNSTPDLRDKFIKFDASGGSDHGATGGDLTHTHSGSSHTHSAPGHPHNITTATSTASREVNLGGTQAANPTHSHGGTAGAPAYTLGSATATVGSVNHEPSWRTIAYIQQAESVGVSFIPTVVMF